MEKRIAGLLGAVAALGTLTAAQAAPTDVLQANSYADLLNPIPNAAAQLKALDVAANPGPNEAEANVQVAQYYHHHHHHHHHRAYIRAPIIVVPHRRYHHHHHHHHHHHYY